MPGDACADFDAQLIEMVSIRARHACRAMHPDPKQIKLEPGVSIRARHACRAMLRYRMQFI